MITVADERYERLKLADEILSCEIVRLFAWLGHPNCIGCGNEFYCDSDHEVGCQALVYWNKYKDQIITEAEAKNKELFKQQREREKTAS